MQVETDFFPVWTHLEKQNSAGAHALQTPRWCMTPE